jgi:hydrogenase/urease accessory protein HupE
MDAADRRRTRYVPVAAVAALLALPHVLSAHPLSVSYARFAVDPRTVEAVVRLPLDDVDLLLRLDRDLDGTVSDAEIVASRDRIQNYLAKHLHVAANGSTLTPGVARTATWRDPAGALYLETRAAFTSPADIDRIAIATDFLTELYPAHKTLGEIALAGRSETFVFEGAHGYEGRLAATPTWGTAWSFVRLGIEHIFTGYDHILFLFGLLLIGTTLRSLVAIVTSFTVAHSTTLALATLGVVTPIPWTIEAAIALSIVYIGFENVFARDPKYRWKITFLFGLVHGFGFAAVLRDLNLPHSSIAISLFGFNVGVEVGQIAIVSLMYPLLRWLTRSPYRLPVVRFASSAIALVGLIWFYQRIP